MRNSLLLLCGIISLIHTGFTESGDGVFEGSGGFPTTLITIQHNGGDDNEPGDADSDITFVSERGSGNVIDGEDEEEIGSGMPDTTTLRDIGNMKCSAAYCWCRDSDGNEIPGSRKFSIEDAPVCPDPFEETTTIIPVRPRPVEEEIIPIQVDHYGQDTRTEKTPPPYRVDTGVKSTIEEEIIPIQVDHYGQDTRTEKTPPPYRVDTSVKSTEMRFREHTTAASKVAKGSSSDMHRNGEVESEALVPGVSLLGHPGILAAVIGGGVVGLLCAILLVMFIVYRMKKKDEGSYATDDSKPLRMHGGYSPAPTKEFYA